MPAPPILDVYVVWHPDDEDGALAFDRIHAHFHSDGYSGLAGGAVEVYARSVGWLAAEAPPRPLLLPGTEAENVRPAQFSAIVPVLGAGLRNAVQRHQAWADYLRLIASSASDAIAVLPVTVPGVNLTDSTVQSIIGTIQRLLACPQ